MTDAELIERLADALEQLLIGIGMGWDLDGFILTAQTALRQWRDR